MEAVNNTVTVPVGNHKQWFEVTKDQASDVMNRTGIFFTKIEEAFQESYSSASRTEFTTAHYIILAYAIYAIAVLCYHAYNTYFPTTPNNENSDKLDLTPGNTTNQENEDTSMKDTLKQLATARRFIGVLKREKKEIKEQLQEQNELVDDLSHSLSENYEALNKIWREKNNVSHVELKTLISYVLPINWTALQYHERIERQTQDYRLTILANIKGVDEAIRNYRAKQRAISAARPSVTTNPLFRYTAGKTGLLPTPKSGAWPTKSVNIEKVD